jgi:hypothetical protein
MTKEGWKALHFKVCILKTENSHKKSLVHAVAQWLRHCAKNRKVAGSIPDGVNGILH